MDFRSLSFLDFVENNKAAEVGCTEPVGPQGVNCLSQTSIQPFRTSH